MGFGLLWHLHVFGVLRCTVVSASIFLSSDLLHWTLGFDGGEAGRSGCFAAAAHEGDEVVLGGWNGLGGWRGSNESNGFGRTNSQNGSKHALGPFLNPGPVEPVQPTGSGWALKQ
ncbi:hypothetical protein SLEP1_g59098 [Rubroshorea leprosula]|uniref:Secreted protein n=1 Tax=Rubroshorea leprosula TaxID=152421 RepID=A0AAV5MRS4_9ROSI|nr:hypothetical protein SLEP1_g59098 [Rubroshorea leprosula]